MDILKQGSRPLVQHKLKIVKPVLLLLIYQFKVWEEERLKVEETLREKYLGETCQYAVVSPILPHPRARWSFRDTPPELDKCILGFDLRPLKRNL